MYRRAGIAFAVLWIAALTLLLGAVAAWLMIGSQAAALSFLGAAIALAPPVQQVIGDIWHKLLPAKVAYYAVITLVPTGLLFVVIDGVAKLDGEAQRRGFASAGVMARAHDLGVTTPEALAAFEQEARMARMAGRCAEHSADRPLDCFEASHRKAALAVSAALLGDGAYPQIVRDAVGRQRKAFLAADRNCATLLDRIDEDAVPVLIDRQQDAVRIVAEIWARRLSRVDLENLAARSRPGVTLARAAEGPSESTGLESKVAGLASSLDGEFDVALQAWSVRIVKQEPAWQALLRGRGPPGTCKPADEVLVR